MYKQLLALVLLLAIIAWVYVTVVINRTFSSVEGFSNGLPNENDNNYLKKLNDELLGMANFMGKEKFNNKEGVTPVINSLKDFVISKSDEYNRNNGYPDKKPKKDLPKGDKLAETNKTKCRFMPSYSESYTCPEKHSSHLGAVFGAKAHSGISCNGKKFTAETAKAYSVIREGKLIKIKLIASGNHYHKPPKVKIMGGGGRGAKARAILADDNSIKTIKITSQGEGYTSSPKIIISNPDGFVYCHLCCNMPE